MLIDRVTWLHNCVCESECVCLINYAEIHLVVNQSNKRQQTPATWMLIG